MKRISLYYLASYLLAGGVGLVLAPATALGLLQANGAYGDVMPRLVGLLMLALGALVSMIIRHRLEMFYRFMVELRLVLMTGIVWLFVRTHDPLFLVLLATVGIGVILTVAGMIVDEPTKRRAEVVR